MKLAILTDITEHTGSWVGRYEPLARELVKRGHQVTLLAPHPRYPNMSAEERVRWRDGIVIRYVGPCFYRETLHGRRYVRTKTMLRLAVGTILRMALEAWRMRYDALLVAKPLPLAGSAALLLRTVRRRPMLVDCDDFELYTNNHQGSIQRLALQLFETVIPRLAHRVTTHSAFLERRMQTRGVPRHRLYYLPNGIDVARLGEGWPDFTKPAREVRILYFGDLNLDTGHNVNLLLEALAHCAGANGGTPFRLHIAGDGKDEPMLRRLATQLGINDLVEWRGRIDPFVIGRDLARADLTVDPVSLSPGNLGRCPLKILEAMHFGLPVITSDVGERRRLLQDAGCYVPPGDARGLGDALRTLIDDTDLRRHLGRRAQTLARSYRWSVLAGSFDELLFSRGAPKEIESCTSSS